jgi:hypothetical protein
MPFLDTQHVISIVPTLIPCLEQGCREEHWGYRFTCSSCPRLRSARRPGYVLAEQDGLTHLREKGQIDGDD